MRSQKLYYVHLHLTSITKEKRERDWVSLHPGLPQGPTHRGAP